MQAWDEGPLGFFGLLNRLSRRSLSVKPLPLNDLLPAPGHRGAVEIQARVTQRHLFSAAGRTSTARKRGTLPRVSLLRPDCTSSQTVYVLNTADRPVTQSVAIAENLQPTVSAIHGFATRV